MVCGRQARHSHRDRCRPLGVPDGDSPPRPENPEIHQIPEIPEIPDRVAPGLCLLGAGSRSYRLRAVISPLEVVAWMFSVALPSFLRSLPTRP